MEPLSQLYRDIQPRLFMFFYVKTGHFATAEDLTQDVFYEAYKNIAQFQGNASLKTWVFAIAQNRLKKFYRSKAYSQQLQQWLEDGYQPTVLSTERQVELKDETRALWQALASLDETTREIALLRLYGELSFKEISVLVVHSENYCRVTFHRTKIKLQKQLGGSL